MKACVRLLDVGQHAVQLLLENTILLQFQKGKGHDFMFAKK